MDRLSNNEALISCAILHTMGHNVSDVALIDLMVVLCVDRAIRQRLSKYATYSDFVRGESMFENALNRKFKEMQPMIINAMSMLLMSGMITNLEKNIFILTLKVTTQVSTNHRSDSILLEPEGMLAIEKT